MSTVVTKRAVSIALVPDADPDALQAMRAPLPQPLPAGIPVPEQQAEPESALASRWLRDGATIALPSPRSQPETGVADKKVKSKRSKQRAKACRAKKDASVSALSPGSARGIETMFRSAYRTQLDLTALAATKANIMISLNGFILSVLTLSGPFVLVAEPLFTIPIAVFLATCLLSIIFAVLAARPHRHTGRAMRSDFKNDRANLLVFEDFSRLKEKDYVQEMLGLMTDNRRIYKNMTRQIHMLGQMADRTFRLLSISYGVFLAGLTISTLLLLGIGFFHNTPDIANLINQVQIRDLG